MQIIVTFCRNGCSNTGTLIAIINLLENLKVQNEVDVLRTVKDLRDMRPNMVDKLVSLLNVLKTCKGDAGGRG